MGDLRRLVEGEGGHFAVRILSAPVEQLHGVGAGEVGQGAGGVLEVRPPAGEVALRGDAVRRRVQVELLVQVDLVLVRLLLGRLAWLGWLSNATVKDDEKVL